MTAKRPGSIIAPLRRGRGVIGGIGVAFARLRLAPAEIGAQRLGQTLGAQLFGALARRGATRFFLGFPGHAGRVTARLVARQDRRSAPVINSRATFRRGGGQ